MVNQWSKHWNRYNNGRTRRGAAHGTRVVVEDADPQWPGHGAGIMICRCDFVIELLGCSIQTMWWPCFEEDEICGSDPVVFSKIAGAVDWICVCN